MQSRIYVFSCRDLLNFIPSLSPRHGLSSLKHAAISRNQLLHRLNKNPLLIQVFMYNYATTRLIFPSYLRQRYQTHVLLTCLVSNLNFLLSTPILPKILTLNTKPHTI